MAIAAERYRAQGTYRARKNATFLLRCEEKRRVRERGPGLAASGFDIVKRCEHALLDDRGNDTLYRR